MALCNKKLWSGGYQIPVPGADWQLENELLMISHRTLWMPGTNVDTAHWRSGIGPEWVRYHPLLDRFQCHQVLSWYKYRDSAVGSMLARWQTDLMSAQSCGVACLSKGCFAGTGAKMGQITFAPLHANVVRNMDKIDRTNLKKKTNKTWMVCIILGMYLTYGRFRLYMHILECGIEYRIVIHNV